MNVVEPVPSASGAVAAPVLGAERESSTTFTVPVVPAVGLSAATGGAFLLGSAGVLGSATGTGISCLFAAATGVDCPFCGLTHGVAALGAGDVGAALAANPLAPLAVALALMVPLALLRRRSLEIPTAAPWALVALVLAVWLARIL